MRNPRTKKLVTLAMFSAIAYILASLIRIPIVPSVGFLGYEPKDVILVIAGFLYGPLSPFVMAVVISLVEGFTTSALGPIGIPMNFISSCAFACTASFIYKKRHTLSGAAAGLAAGTILTAAVMLLWNYALTPILMGYPREVVVKMLLPGFLPFNLIKCGLNVAITMLIYKPIRKALDKSHLLPISDGGGAKPVKKIKIGAVVVSLLVVLTCVLVVLSLRGII